ncbi:homoserine kinase [Lichenihabitans sp. Uapishka_5]|uniref:homoserine kinase n=1 Tax=Lichenihabitans sp. Uapishka_5 TaxID=3037302 RepID=UPI0029E8139A|nr:homoserine kinase [Lichenihabitans sp. Uapishka_5]MDX7951028.1 homoserine kinase [Lichenihabitans sp. Uapishka_5]
MAVYTDVSASDLDGFLRTYDIGGLTALKGIAEGVENSNFLLGTTAGTYILTLYEKRVAAGDLPFFVALLEHLAAKGLTCPQPVPNRAGAALGTLCGRPAAIMTFLDGVWIADPQPIHCGALGAVLAQLHLAVANFPMGRPNPLSVAGWHGLLAQAGARADTVVPGLAAEAAAALADIEARWPVGLPMGVIHADLFPDNVFFLGDRLSGLIDFYFACTDSFAYDLSICLNAWCFDADHRFDPARGRALMEGYAAVRPLNPAEAAALPVLARGSALRFMLTRLVDWLNVPPGALVKPKDPREYLAKLRFHVGVEDSRIYGLPG